MRSSATHRNAVLQAFVDGALCFFVPYLASSPQGADSATDLFAVGKTAYICLLGVVNLELVIVSRYWTWWFGVATLVSWLIGFPFILIYSAIEKVFDTVDMSAFAMGQNLFANVWFWVVLLTVYTLSFVLRYIERSFKLLFRPDEVMVRAELEEAKRRGDPGARTDEESMHGWAGERRNGGNGANGGAARGGDSVFGDDSVKNGKGTSSGSGRKWGMRKRGQKGSDASDRNGDRPGPSQRSVQLSEVEAGRGNGAGGGAATALGARDGQASVHDAPLSPMEARRPPEPATQVRARLCTCPVRGAPRRLSPPWPGDRDILHACSLVAARSLTRALQRLSAKSCCAGRGRTSGHGDAEERRRRHSGCL